MTRKIFLYFFILLGIVGVAALSFGVYVWWSLQGLHDAAETETASSTPVVTETTDTRDMEVVREEREEIQEETLKITESVTIPASALTEDQKETAETFGLDTENLTITPEMVVCMEGKLGSERLGEILAGATPGPLESLSLLSCLR